MHTLRAPRPESWSGVAGEANLNGKILIDVANPLDFSRGMPPTLAVANTDSLGEQLQRLFPQVRVVKALNTVTASVMVDPRRLADGDHHVFVSGDDPAARTRTTDYSTAAASGSCTTTSTWWTRCWGR